jgi:hypothetical protein
MRSSIHTRADADAQRGAAHQDPEECPGQAPHPHHQPAPSDAGEQRIDRRPGHRLVGQGGDQQARCTVKEKGGQDDQQHHHGEREQLPGQHRQPAWAQGEQHLQGVPAVFPTGDQHPQQQGERAGEQREPLDCGGH